MRKINVFDVEYGIYYTIETGFILYIFNRVSHMRVSTY